MGYHAKIAINCRKGKDSGFFRRFVGLLFGGIVKPFVGLHYALHQGMAHNVFLAELHAPYAGHVAQHLQRLKQTRAHRFLVLVPGGFSVLV